MLFWVRLFLFYGVDIPSLTPIAIWDYISGHSFLLQLLFTPMLLSLVILGYPTWRFVVIRIARAEYATWVCFGGGALAMALTSVLPFIVLLGFAGEHGEIVKSLPLFLFLGGVVVSGAFAVAHLLYRAA